MIARANMRVTGASLRNELHWKNYFKNDICNNEKLDYIGNRFINIIPSEHINNRLKRWFDEFREINISWICVMKRRNYENDIHGWW